MGAMLFAIVIMDGWKLSKRRIIVTVIILATTSLIHQYAETNRNWYDKFSAICANIRLEGLQQNGCHSLTENCIHGG